MISVCIPVKNRVDNLKRCVESLDAAGVDEIVVADFRSDDTDFKWFNHSAQKVVHKLVTVEDEHFSVGAGKNAAAAAATGDVLFFLDADLTVNKEVINFITDAIADGDVVAPIMQMQNEDGSLGDWAVHSFGQVALLKTDFDNGEKWQPWRSYGGEDNLFIAQFQHRLLRPRIAGFIHHWHPHELREKYSEAPAYEDLRKFDKEFKPMKVYAHDPRFVFNGRYNSFPDAVVVREIWCENVYEVFDGDFDDTKIAVDLGANIGAFSLFAAKLGATKVIAVEPEPNNLELLRQNILENQTHVPNCEFVVDTHGVGGEAKKMYITNMHGDSRVHPESERLPEMNEVDIITLDDLFKRHGLEYIDVLKVDIEGLEGEVILNTSQATMNLCRYITMEYDQNADDLGAIVEKISQTHQIKFVGAHGGMLFAKRY